MKQVKTLIILGILVLNQSVSFGQKRQLTDSTLNNWHVRISPYFWFVGYKGSVYIPPEPSNLPNIEPVFDVEIGFRELRSSIKFALMLAGEQMTEHTYSRFHFFGLILDGGAKTRWDIIFQNIDLRLATFGGDAAIGYRIVKKPKFELDGTLGIKWFFAEASGRTDIIGHFPIDYRVKRNWIDPAIGTHISWRFIPNLTLKNFTDVGFILGDQFTYQSMTEVNYFLNRRWYAAAGYRIWYVRFPKEEAIYTGQIRGWIIRVGVQF